MATTTIMLDILVRTSVLLPMLRQHKDRNASKKI